MATYPEFKGFRTIGTLKLRIKQPHLQVVYEEKFTVNKMDKFTLIIIKIPLMNFSKQQHQAPRPATRRRVCHILPAQPFQDGQMPGRI